MKDTRDGSFDRDARPGRVLIVDGSRFDAERSRMELRRSGVANECRIVTDVAELGPVLRTFLPDIVICEWVFAGSDGPATQRIVREVLPDVPVIVVSSSSSGDTASAVLQSGAVDYVPKAGLFRLPGAVQQAVREAKERARLQVSVGSSGLRSREHVKRLEKVWRVVNDPESQDNQIAAVLTEAVAGIGRGFPYFAMVGHIVGSEFVIDAVAGNLGSERSAARRMIFVGNRGPLGDVFHALDLAAGRTNSWDDIDAFPNPPAYAREAGLKCQITTQFSAAGTPYMLTIGSLFAPAATPFGAEDYAYIEVVGSILARRFERDRHEESLREAEERSRRQAERVDALSRMLNNSPQLHRDDLFPAMLREAANALRPGQLFGATLGHIEGSQIVLDAVSIEHLGAAARNAARDAATALRPGMRIEMSDTLHVHDLAAGRTQSWEDCQTLAELPERTRKSGLRSQIMTQFSANGTLYVLTLGSLEPPSGTPFSNEDYDYIETLGALFARRLEHEALEGSLREAESRSRRHTQRLDALWIVVNNPNLRGQELVAAMLHEAAKSIRSGQEYIGILRHVEGSEYVIDAVSGKLPADSDVERLLAVGTRIELSTTLYLSGAGRTQAFDDVQAVPDIPLRARLIGWRSLISTTFEVAGALYELVFGSLTPQMGFSFAQEDAEYIEVLASALARRLELEKMEASLGQAESRARQHAERLEALWRVSNNPTLQGQELVQQMLEHAATAIRPSQPFIGLLSRIEGDEIVIIAEGTPGHSGIAPVGVGTRVALAKTLIPNMRRSQAWDDLTQTGDDSRAGEADRGWRALISTKFDAAGVYYALAFASPEPANPPFGGDDIGYLEVLASSFAGRLQVDELEESLRESEERTRQHAARLEGLWKLINSSSVRDDGLIVAMLQQAATTIQPGVDFDAMLVRIQGDDVVVESMVRSPNERTGDLWIEVGSVVALEQTSLARVIAEGGGTRSWDDIQSTAYSSPATRSRGTRSLVTTTFTAGGATWGLAFTSTRKSRRPLGPQDHAYVDVLASFFANHLQQRWQFDRIQYQQSHDVLTGLLNRSTFRSQARTSARTAAGYGIVMIDIDGLHEVNEAYGHVTGDAVLVEVGNGLRGRARGAEIVGRFGGDVFAIYIPEPASPEDFFARVIDFAGIFERPFSTGDREGKEFVSRTACLGIAAAPADGTEFESILSRADAALYTAQERGRGSMVFYAAGMEAEAQRRAALNNELREAIVEEQFTLYFQPHLEVKTGRVSGCEALIRWNHPVRGVLLPASFIPFAEQNGMIANIDAWVMNNAFAAALDLGALRTDFRLFFNLSGRQAGDPKVVHALADAARFGLPLKNLGVEITETDAMRDVNATRRVCRALRRLNVRVAIDDFGTGYSSLSSLKRLPVDIVKIDRTFISGVLKDPHDQTIAETIITIAERFGFETLAEGVERPEELEWTNQHSCRYAQGYFVCHPLPFAEFKTWLTDYDNHCAKGAGP